MSVLTTKVRIVASFPGHSKISRLYGVSSWYHAMKVIALCLHLKSKIQRREIKKHESLVTMSSTQVEKLILRVTRPELQEAEKIIIRCLQNEHFREELQITAT